MSEQPDAQQPREFPAARVELLAVWIVFREPKLAALLDPKYEPE